jgi:ribosomal protein S18 acetylase RimI-like enzyme
VDAFAIRPAEAADAEAFVRAYEISWDATLAQIVGRRLGELVPFDARVEAFRTGIEKASDDARVWVAERDGAIVGIAVCLRQDGDVCELRDLYVVPEAWGSGVARALMDAALEPMRERGVREAILWVGSDNARARRFYERKAWTADGESRTSVVGPEEVRYRRAL